MDSRVSARMPMENRARGDEALARIGAATTQLINAAYDYAIATGKLPQAAADGRASRAKPRGELAQAFRERLSRTTHAVPAAYFSSHVDDKMLEAELRACPQSFPDIANILRRAIPPWELQRMMRESLEFIAVCTTGQDDVESALDAAWDDVEDALVERCAQRVKADYLITRDANSFAKAGVEALTPRSWLQMMEGKHGLVYEDLSIDQAEGA